MGIPNNLTQLLRNLYVGKEATVRTGHGTMDQFQIVKGVHEGCHPAYLTYTEECIVIKHNENAPMEVWK